MRQARLRFDFNRGRAEAIGVTHSRWRSAGDHHVCKVCRARNGKRFALGGVDDFNDPRSMLCARQPIDDDEESTSQPCRCSAEMPVPALPVAARRAQAASDRAVTAVCAGTDLRPSFRKAGHSSPNPSAVTAAMERRASPA